MTLDKSLKPRNKHVRQRNVLTREERIERLIEDERWTEEDSVFGLPKVKPITFERPSASPEEEEEEEAAEEGMEAAGEAAEGEGAKEEE